MKKRANMKGWTLIELIIVIVIIGLLAVVALPRYFDLRDEAERASIMGVVGAVRSGIAIHAADNLVTTGTLNFPTSLTNTDPFDEVLQITVDDWTKAAEAEEYTDPAGDTWTYNSTDGTFTE